MEIEAGYYNGFQAHRPEGASVMEEIQLKVFDKMFTFHKDDMGEWQAMQPITGPVMTPILNAALNRIEILQDALHDAEAIGDFPTELRSRHLLNERNRHLKVRLIKAHDVVLRSMKAIEFDISIRQSDSSPARALRKAIGDYLAEYPKIILYEDEKPQEVEP